MKHVFYYTQTVHQIIMLEYHAGFDSYAAKLPAFDMSNIPAVKKYGALRCINQPVDAAQES